MDNRKLGCVLWTFLARRMDHMHDQAQGRLGTLILANPTFWKHICVVMYVWSTTLKSGRDNILSWTKLPSNNSVSSNGWFPHFNILASICCNTILSSLPTPCWSARLCPLTSSLGPPGCSRCQWRCCDGSWRAQTFSWLGFSQEWSMTDGGQGEESQTHAMGIV